MKKSITIVGLLALSLPLYAADLYTGDGGRGIRLAIAAPAGKNLAADEAWLPFYVQGMLTGNFNKYSAMTIIDRQNMDKVEGEQNLSLSGNFSDADYIKIGNLTNAQYILAGSLEKLRGDAFSVQLSITALETGTVRASFTKTCTAAELRGGTVINEAGADLLAKMGVQLTGTGKRELQTGTTANTDAQTALAKGISAQQSGNAVEALSYFYQAAAVDPSSAETAGRLNLLSSRISGGDLGQNVRNQIAQRNAWIAILKDCAAFYKNHMPFDIVYDPVLRQIGDTDYANATADFSFTVELPPAEAAFKVINDLISGLEATGQRSTWDFTGWPLINGSKYPEPAAVVFGGNRSFAFAVVAAIIDGKGKTIGTDNFTLTSGNISFNSGDRMITPPAKVSREATFRKVNIKDYTPPLNVKIVSVNKIPSETVNETGYMRVLTQAEHYALPEEAAKRQAAAEQAEALRIAQAEQAAIQEKQRKQEEKRRKQERIKDKFSSWIAGDNAIKLAFGYVFNPRIPFGLRVGAINNNWGWNISGSIWAPNPSKLPGGYIPDVMDREVVLDINYNFFLDIDVGMYRRLLNNFFLDVGIGFFLMEADTLHNTYYYDSRVYSQSKEYDGGTLWIHNSQYSEGGFVLQGGLLYSFKWFYLHGGYKQYFDDNFTSSFYAGVGFNRALPF
ncbi:hypothetical protein AGMMS50212_06170 [Spirochaetia bacterium]|nr:hypothetical protein AGMMS50212_06170 [Spirochaetia bacterium]